jgi:hypothetical protein
MIFTCQHLVLLASDKWVSNNKECTFRTVTFWLGKTLSYKDLCQYIIFNHVHLCPEQTRYDYNFHMWVDYAVPKWFLTSTNFYRSPFSKWPPQYRTNSILLSTHISNFDDIGQCWIFAVLWWSFWKRQTSRKILKRRIAPLMVTQHPELIPDIEKCLPVSIFKMADTIPQKFNIVRFQR